MIKLSWKEVIRIGGHFVAEKGIKPDEVRRALRVELESRAAMREDFARMLAFRDEFGSFETTRKGETTIWQVLGSVACDRLLREIEEGLT